MTSDVERVHARGHRSNCVLGLCLDRAEFRDVVVAIKSRDRNLSSSGIAGRARTLLALRSRAITKKVYGREQSSVRHRLAERFLSGRCAKRASIFHVRAGTLAAGENAARRSSAYDVSARFYQDSLQIGRTLGL